MGRGSISPKKYSPTRGSASAKKKNVSPIKIKGSSNNNTNTKNSKVAKRLAFDSAESEDFNSGDCEDELESDELEVSTESDQATSSKVKNRDSSEPPSESKKKKKEEPGTLNSCNLHFIYSTIYSIFRIKNSEKQEKKRGSWNW